MKASPMPSEKKDQLERSEKEVSKHTVTITKVNDVHTYDADVIGTFSQSSGTVSYDSIRSMKNESLQKAQINGKYVGSYSGKKIISSDSEITTNKFEEDSRVIFRKNKSSSGPEITTNRF
ncbi:unnamed protein product [Onchocerca flexuosa]|uniref:OstA-like_N domain-containing protein n=1 Tax=Onchocerca flexuosa TaxID=387005 RepID=A0A183HU66_9BILA|nr:unnamed protein product [Onchocerca flexuosa]